MEKVEELKLDEIMKNIIQQNNSYLIFISLFKTTSLIVIVYLIIIEH